MLHISDIQKIAPSAFRTPLQEAVYKTLAELQIPFERVDTDEVITMEDCAWINEKLDMKMVKTLFLCDRTKTRFFLFVTAGDKPFRAKEFSAALGVSRLSFAPADLMEEMLGTKIGAATVFSALVDKTEQVHIVIDNDVTLERWYGCSDGTTTGYMKIETSRILNDFLPVTGHTPTLISV